MPKAGNSSIIMYAFAHFHISCWRIRKKKYNPLNPLNLWSKKKRRTLRAEENIRIGYTELKVRKISVIGYAELKGS